ncbi:DUF309 domain-containing protein [Paenibacillus sp. N4]|uniref:DUF309 domain-containing protein n=1 Tax=Paenibacillus vietnamensis TaxID=2590547 RepID=UPI001CD0DA9D|nr:DUF309 domain-containing protein [Paenibacillus vietnamensis]MCA0758531.1 DUF309 domain-containing protein [Paenibacillus vietnamensis]
MKTFPHAYVCFLVEFHASRDYFECHELLEEYWKEHPGDPLSETWVGLIQLAVGLYHERRGNRRGALKMLMKAEAKLSAAPIDTIGLDKQRLLEQLARRTSQLSRDESLDGGFYTDLDLLITSTELRSECEAECVKRGLDWGKPSRLEDAGVIHRHKLRDRSEVVAARQSALADKKKERGGKA